jgi:hypothetical protein
VIQTLVLTLLLIDGAYGGLKADLVDLTGKKVSTVKSKSATASKLQENAWSHSARCEWACHNAAAGSFAVRQL